MGGATDRGEGKKGGKQKRGKGGRREKGNEEDTWEIKFMSKDEV